MNVPCIEESLASCRRLGRDAEGDLLGDVALAISVQFGAPLGSGSEMERKSTVRRKSHTHDDSSLMSRDGHKF